MQKEGSAITSYTYDGRNNCVSEISGDVEKTYEYNNSDMVTEYVISVNDGEKQKVTNTYDVSGNKTHVYENDALKASYTYDKWGKLIKTEGGNGNIEEKYYNTAGLVTAVVNRRGGNILSQYAYTYYYDGNECTKTDSRGTTVYKYDGAGELEKEIKLKTEEDNTTTENAAELRENMHQTVSVTENGQKRYYRYVPVFTGVYTLESCHNSSDPKVAVYDTQGNLIMQNEDGGDGKNFYLNLNLNAGSEYIIAVSEQSGKGAFEFSLKRNGETDNTVMNGAVPVLEDVPVCVELKNRTEVKYYSLRAKTSGTYLVEASDSTNMPIVRIYKSDGTHLAGAMTGGLDEWKKAECQLTEGEAYIIKLSVYGDAGTVTLNVTPPNHEKRNVTEYTYDGNGNRKKMRECKDGSVTETVYTYDKNDQLLAETEGDDTISYTYDANGNMTAKSNGINQTFDTLNRMNRYESTDGVVTTYSYYADDMRKSKKTGDNAEIIQIWSDEDIVLEMENGNVRSSYVYGDKLICSTYGWYVYNEHGDVTALTAANGTIIRNYEYNSFGVQESGADGADETDDTDENPFRYSGEYYDKESGYTYLQARYYDPNMGRFISEDPAMDGDNWYVYCGNDPINMADPTGMWFSETHEELTRIAFKKIKLKKYKKVNKLISRKKTGKKLKEGCTFPDKERQKAKKEGRKTIFKNKMWHGQYGYRGVMSSQLSKAKRVWKQGKYGKAFGEIGKALHTIQDHYAHTVELNGKTVETREVAGGYIHSLVPEGLEDHSDLILGTHPEYVSYDYYLECANNKDIGKRNYLMVHSITADNPRAYFNGSQWVRTTKANNPRYQNAKNESIKYLRRAMKAFEKIGGKKHDKK